MKKFLKLMLEQFRCLLYHGISGKMLMPDLLPIRIPKRDNVVNNIKQVLKFSNSELETSLALFHHGARR